MRKIVFYHTDLDGYGVKVAAKIYYTLKGINLNDVTFIKADYYGEKLLLDKMIDKNVKGHENEIDEIILGDISVTKKETAEYLNGLTKNIHIILRDHHDTAVWMNEYPYAKVREKDENGILRSGTYWIAEELLSKEYIEKHPNLKKFIYLTDMLDTWKWAKCTPKLTDAEDLSIAFEALTEEGFDRDIYPKLLLETEVDLYDEKVRFYLESTHRELDKKAWAAYFSMQTGTYIYKDGEKEVPLKVGIISTTSGASMIIERLRDIFAKNNNHYDFLLNLSMKGGLALRADENCKVPVNLIIKQMGVGGGHPGSAGGMLPDGAMKKGLEAMFENLKMER